MVYLGLFGPLRKLLGITENAIEVTDSTPTTPAGNRKMSVTSVSMTLDSTLDRRRM